MNINFSIKIILSRHLHGLAATLMSQLWRKTFVTTVVYLQLEVNVVLRKQLAVNFLSILVSVQTYSAAASSYLGQLDLAPPDLPEHLHLMALAETFERISDATAPLSVSPYQPSAQRLLAPPPSVFDDGFNPFGANSAPTFQVNLTTGRGSQRGPRQRQTPPNFQEVSSKKMMDSGEHCAACKRPGHDATRFLILAQILWAL